MDEKSQEQTPMEKLEGLGKSPEVTWEITAPEAIPEVRPEANAHCDQCDKPFYRKSRLKKYCGESCKSARAEEKKAEKKRSAEDLKEPKAMLVKPEVGRLLDTVAKRAARTTGVPNNPNPPPIPDPLPARAFPPIPRTAPPPERKSSDEESDALGKKISDAAKDGSVGTPAPHGRFTNVREEPIQTGEGSALHSLFHGIRETADFWPAGDADAGFAADIRTGKLYPRIKHISETHPLTNADGTSNPVELGPIELRRRNWYSELMRRSKRLTPVHHILGCSNPAWHFRLSGSDVEDRDAWRVRLFEPENMYVLLKTYNGIYDIDWKKLSKAKPREKILFPIRRELEIARAKNDHRADAWELRYRRATSEIEILCEVALAVQQGEMKSAGQWFEKFAALDAMFEEEIAPHVSLIPGLMGASGALKSLR